ncbi:hypothetical protein C475_13642 [Halosimplex carlsbadense 2-9-1]|uniref:Probable inorganic carbon transporter subunit DabA n=1 Tax=Halosimplex carlsbadense 2-9-1 TaxID=797114 RepID=M0CM19_9EURY|nr:DUF2309 domain-containing protein [Halosimplex carlsbadense]ELZ24296.1 hypothetical protein C475_13642 [Halosimplex carlsbadense 2-9-1]
MTLERATLEDSIDRAAEAVGSVWPLHSFVTANPLAGFEDRPFHRAVADAEELFGGRGYPHPSVFRQAWEAGRIDPDLLGAELDAHGVSGDPEALLDEMATAESERETRSDADDATEAVDRILSKWLAAFLDQGQAQWSMPGRERGFYAAWRELAPHDGEIPGCDDPSDLPETPVEALEAVLSDYPEGRWESVFERHLAALPGWTGFVKQRADGHAGPWQSKYPVSLLDYLAVRLTLADLLGAPVDPDDGGAVDDHSHPAAGDGPDETPLAEVWLSAWEKSYRSQLLDGVDRSVTESSTDSERPAAQLVFCIDTRSEVVRRHIEAAGPYETHGYAGFFGVPMRYEGHDSDAEIDACPPIVDPEYRVTERPHHDHQEAAHDRWAGLATAARKHLKSLKTNVAAAFTFVEGGGSAYGAAMATRTLLPSVVADFSDAVDDRVPSPAEFCEPTLDRRGEPESDALPRGMTLSEKVECAETAFELMGWEEFARLVVFAGHASETTNNPFDSSLDCGACAGNPGGPNARALAAICNDDEVRAELRERGFEIPEDTVFLAGEHNTTTDEIDLFDGPVPESHEDDLERLRADLDEARAGATAERAESMPGSDPDDGVRETKRRTADWAETRPEWGLAGNASFVIGPRELTAGEDLDGRAFLHSYDWATDPDGEALEAIVAGPLVVTQWINSQYYFATVDNAVYGSGSKVTQNARGNVGVVQGNGGDLMTGLPLQSLNVDSEQPYHQPLRLTAVIHAPVERVTDILARHEEVAKLFDNGWISLSVVDPEQDNAAVHYQGDLEWERADAATPLVH